MSEAPHIYLLAFSHNNSWYTPKTAPVILRRVLLNIEKGSVVVPVQFPDNTINHTMKAISDGCGWPAKRYNRKVRDVQRVARRFDAIFDEVIGAEEGIVYRRCDNREAEKIGLPSVTEDDRKVIIKFLKEKLPLLAASMSRASADENADFEVTDEAAEEAAMYMIKEFAIFHAVPELIGHPDSKMTLVYHSELGDTPVFKHFVESHENIDYWPLNDPGTSRRVNRILQRESRRLASRRLARSKRQESKRNGEAEAANGEQAQKAKSKREQTKTESKRAAPAVDAE